MKSERSSSILPSVVTMKRDGVKRMEEDHPALLSLYVFLKEKDLRTSSVLPSLDSLIVFLECCLSFSSLFGENIGEPQSDAWHYQQESEENGWKFQQMSLIVLQLDNRPRFQHTHRNFTAVIFVSPPLFRTPGNGAIPHHCLVKDVSDRGSIPTPNTTPQNEQ